MWCVLSVYDSKAEEYGMLYLARTTLVGSRMFADAILHGEQSMLRQHPEDFELHLVGSFDEESGNLEGRTEFEFVTSALEVMRDHQRQSPQLELSGGV